MDIASGLYLGITFGLVLILAGIIFRTYRRGKKEELESKLVIGVFVDRQAPEFNDECEAIIERAKESKRKHQH